MIFWKRILPFKVISFDLDDTLYDNVPIMYRAEELFAAMLCDRYGLDPYARDPVYWKIIKRTLTDEDPKLLDDVTISRAVGLIKGFEILKKPLKGGMEEALSLVDEFIKVRSDFKVPMSSCDLLSILSERYVLAALSNGNVDMEAIGIKKFFTFNLRPGVDGLRRKPNADLFERLAKLAKVELHEILHVGDEPTTDIKGAAEAGVQCAWLRGGYSGRSLSFYRLSSVPHVVLESLTELLTLTEANAQKLQLPRHKAGGLNEQ